MDIIRYWVLAALLGISAPAALVAQDKLVARGGTGFSMAIEGTRQGMFPGGPAGIAGLRFSYALKSPRDVASGQASGKRQHGPVVFTKLVGAGSPQLFQALATNEILKSVVLNLPGYLITLTNATISEVKQYTEVVDGRAAVLEDVSLTFQRIEVQDPGTRSVAVDDWMATK
ncbi:MAG TPA: type VI secretion system tube protein Hcp [Gemmatimonadales bacterium]